MIKYRSEREAVEVAGQLQESEEGGWLYKALQRFTNCGPGRARLTWAVQCIGPKGEVEYW